MKNLLPMIPVIIGILLGWFVSDRFLSAESTLTCDTLDAIGMDAVQWDDAHYTWPGLPDDLRLVRFVYLNDARLPDDQVRAVEYEYSASTGELWVIGYNSMAITTVNGHTGQHDICAYKMKVAG